MCLTCLCKAKSVRVCAYVLPLIDLAYVCTCMCILMLLLGVCMYTRGIMPPNLNWDKLGLGVVRTGCQNYTMSGEQQTKMARKETK